MWGCRSKIVKQVQGLRKTTMLTMLQPHSTALVLFDICSAADQADS